MESLSLSPTSCSGFHRFTDCLARQQELVRMSRHNGANLRSERDRSRRPRKRRSTSSESKRRRVEGVVAHDRDLPLVSIRTWRKHWCTGRKLEWSRSVPMRSVSRPLERTNAQLQVAFVSSGDRAWRAFASRSSPGNTRWAVLREILPNLRLEILKSEVREQ